MRQQIFILFGLLLAAAAFGDPDIEVTPAEHDFGVVEVGDSASIVFELNNIGDSVLRLDEVTLVSSNNEDYKITSLLYLPAFYGPGGSFHVEVVYAPSSSGESEAILSVFSSDPDQPWLDIFLTGEAPPDGMTPAEQIAALIEFFDQSVRAGDIKGAVPRRCKKARFRGFRDRDDDEVKSEGRRGTVQLRTFRRRLEFVQRSVDREKNRWASMQLRWLSRRIDGQRRPHDWVQGPAVPELAERINQLLQTLEGGGETEDPSDVE